MILFTPVDLALVEELAESAVPHEACGLLEGIISDAGHTVTAVHPSENVATDPAIMFEVDPRLLLRLQRGLRGRNTGVIGIYHSHPLGSALPSATDLAMAWQPELVWVITALKPALHTAAFHLVDSSFKAMPISVAKPT